MDIIPVSTLGIPVTIIGAGAVGSFTALSLAKMGIGNIKVFDDDKIEEENMNCQFYRFQDIGFPKVLALQSLVRDFTKVEIEAIHGRYTGGHTFPGIVISAVDSMAVRKTIWETHRERAPMTKAVIDPRMGAETALLYVMNPMDPKDGETYAKTLYTDDSAVQERCTEKATVYTACMLAGLVVKAVKDLITTSEYLRVAQWSIKDNQLHAWKKGK
jgi:molybdopterin/thiamine biosynthesis adenylyltransferase